MAIGSTDWRLTRIVENKSSVFHFLIYIYIYIYMFPLVTGIAILVAPCGFIGPRIVGNDDRGGLDPMIPLDRWRHTGFNMVVLFLRSHSSAIIAPSCLF